MPPYAAPLKLCDGEPTAAANQAWVDHAAPKLGLAVQWVMTPPNATTGQAHDASYTHRFYLDADALGETACCSIRLP